MDLAGLKMHEKVYLKLCVRLPHPMHAPVPLLPPCSSGPVDVLLCRYDVSAEVVENVIKPRLGFKFMKEHDKKFDFTLHYPTRKEVYDSTAWGTGVIEMVFVRAGVWMPPSLPPITHGDQPEPSGLIPPPPTHTLTFRLTNGG